MAHGISITLHKAHLLVTTSVQCTTCNINILTKLIIWQDEVVARIEERIAAWTFLPSGTSVDLSITSYVFVFF
jgi:hypothetical protein